MPLSLSACVFSNAVNHSVKLACIVDGFNLYHSIEDAIADGCSPQIKWMDIRRLCESKTKLFGPDAYLDRLVYCTSLVGQHNSPERERQKLFIRVCESRGIKPEYGYFKAKEVRCKVCGQTYRVQVEKQSDLNIGLHIIKAFQDGYDGCMVLSGDSDLQTAIDFASATYMRKVAVLLPYKRHVSSLSGPRYSAQFLTSLDYETNILPSQVRLSENKAVRIPKYWETGVK